MGAEFPKRTAIAAAYREYLFSLARKEADSGCERLSAFKGKLPMYFMDLTASWTIEERYALMSALIKEQAAIQGEAIDVTPEERAAALGFDWPLERKWRTPGKPGALHVSRITGFQLEMDAEKLAEARRSEGVYLGEFKLDRARLRREVGKAMEPVFGKPRSRIGGDWQYWTPLAGVGILTVVDFGARRPTQFRYYQEFYELAHDGGPEQRVFSSRGICDILGCGESRWTYLTDADVPAAAQLLVRLCKEFIDAVPGILERARFLEHLELQ